MPDRAEAPVAAPAPTAGVRIDAARAAVADAVSAAARRLAPSEAPVSAPEADLFAAFVQVADRLYGSGVVALGRLDLIGERLLELLRAEAHARRPASSDDKRASAPPGRVLATLAASRKLRETVSNALGCELAPASAVYLYEPSGSHVRTHLDARGYEVAFHLVLEHARPPGAAGSRLVVHLPGGSRRLAVPPGECVALRGRGTLHSWEPLGPDERRTMIAIGFS